MTDTLKLPDHIAIRYKGIRVFRTYDDAHDKLPLKYWYSWSEDDTDAEDDHGYQFDIRALPEWNLTRAHRDILKAHIEAAVKKFGEIDVDMPWWDAEGQGMYGGVDSIAVLRLIHNVDGGTEEATAQAYLPENSEVMEEDREVLRRFKMSTELSAYPEDTVLFSFTSQTKAGYVGVEGITAADVITRSRSLPPLHRASCKLFVYGQNEEDSIGSAWTDGFFRVSKFYPGRPEDPNITL